MDADAFVSTIGITLAFTVPIGLFYYALFRVGWYYRLAKSEVDWRFKMFTLATLTCLVVGEKAITHYNALVFSQEIFIVFITMPISLFYYNYFMRERSLKTKSLERYHAELITSSALCCIGIAILMKYMAK